MGAGVIMHFYDSNTPLVDQCLRKSKLKVVLHANAIVAYIRVTTYFQIYLKNNKMKKIKDDA